jgi:Short C-terminal domain/Phospholipase_D-nuclease N-terminal
VTVLAEFDLGDALLTTLSIFFVVIWLWILFVILTDLFRDHELSGWAKAIWCFFLIFLPFVTSFIYLIARGKGMRDRAAAQQAEAQKQVDQYIRSAAGSGSSVDELAKLADLKERGAISDEDYQKMKAKLVG